MSIDLSNPGVPDSWSKSVGSSSVNSHLSIGAMSLDLLLHVIDGYPTVKSYDVNGV